MSINYKNVERLASLKTSAQAALHHAATAQDTQHHLKNDLCCHDSEYKLNQIYDELVLVIRKSAEIKEMAEKLLIRELTHEEMES